MSKIDLQMNAVRPIGDHRADRNVDDPARWQADAHAIADLVGCLWHGRRNSTTQTNSPDRRAAPLNCPARPLVIGVLRASWYSDLAQIKIPVSRRRRSPSIFSPAQCTRWDSATSTITRRMRINPLFLLPQPSCLFTHSAFATAYKDDRLEDNAAAPIERDFWSGVAVGPRVNGDLRVGVVVDERVSLRRETRAR